MGDGRLPITRIAGTQQSSLTICNHQSAFDIVPSPVSLSSKRTRHGRRAVLILTGPAAPATGKQDTLRGHYGQVEIAMWKRDDAVKPHPGAAPAGNVQNTQTNQHVNTAPASEPVRSSD